MYFGTPLPEHVITCMLNTPREQFGFHKDQSLSIEQIVEEVEKACLNYSLYIIYDKEILLFFTDQAPYVLHMDSIRGINSSIFDYTKLIKKAVKLFEEKTAIHKLETRTPFTELEILAKRCKWNHEGTYKESYQMPDGSFADELSFGIILKRSEKQLQENISRCSALLGGE
jgi:hypothetical protein